MLENATSVTPFGKEDTAAESQSNAARTQDTLVDAVENAEVTDAVFRALTCLRAAETKELDTIARLETQAIDENNETFRRETVSHEFRTALQQSCMTKKKGKDVISAGAMNAARRAGETVEMKRHLSHPVFFHTSKHRDRLSLLVSIDLSLVVESTV